MLIKGLESEEKTQKRENGGFGFVTFQSNLQVKRCLNAKDFQKLVVDRVGPEDRMRAGVNRWKIKQAPAYSDIIWENMYRDDTLTSIKSWLLMILLFIVCVVLITPISLLDNLAPIIKALTKSLGEDNFFAVILQTYLAPLIMLAFNSALIPLFIDFIAYLEEHKTKSGR